jgi:hypothetical protein
MVGVRLQPEPLARLDAWIAKQDDAPSRPEAARRLIEAGLKVVAEGDTSATTPSGLAATIATALDVVPKMAPEILSADGAAASARRRGEDPEGG